MKNFGLAFCGLVLAVALSSPQASATGKKRKWNVVACRADMFAVAAPGSRCHTANTEWEMQLVKLGAESRRVFRDLSTGVGLTTPFVPANFEAAEHDCAARGARIPNQNDFIALDADGLRQVADLGQVLLWYRFRYGDLVQFLYEGDTGRYDRYGDHIEKRHSYACVVTL